MAVNLKTINLTRGDTREVEVVCTDKAGAVIDITGGTLTLTVDPSDTPVDASTKLIQIIKNTFVAPDDDAVNGIAIITIPHSASNSVAPGSYFYDVQLVEAGGDYTTYGPAPFILGGDVTR